MEIDILYILYCYICSFEDFDMSDVGVNLCYNYLISLFYYYLLGYMLIGLSWKQLADYIIIYGIVIAKNGG